jgi:hypothetical protein
MLKLREKELTEKTICAYGARKTTSIILRGLEQIRRLLQIEKKDLLRILLERLRNTGLVLIPFVQCLEHRKDVAKSAYLHRQANERRAGCILTTTITQELFAGYYVVVAMALLDGMKSITVELQGI